MTNAHTSASARRKDRRINARVNPVQAVQDWLRATARHIGARLSRLGHLHAGNHSAGSGITVIVAVEDQALRAAVVRSLTGAGMSPLIVDRCEALLEICPLRHLAVLETEGDVDRLMDIGEQLFRLSSGGVPLPVVALIHQRAVETHPQFVYWHLDGVCVFFATLVVEDKCFARVIVEYARRIHDVEEWGAEGR